MLKKIIATLLAGSLVLCGNLPFSFIDSEEAEASSYNDLGQLPFMGWSSWSSIRKHPTEEKIKGAADVLAEKFQVHGYQYINLDDYYQLDWNYTVDKYGRWAVDPKKFPHGMKALGDYIHSKGLKFGHYVTLGIPKAAIDQNTPIEGTPYHAKDIVDLSKGQKVNFNFDQMYAIDFSKPGAQEFIDSWAKMFASYGIDYLKIDGVRNEDIADLKAWAKALKKTGRPIHVELSNNLDIDHVPDWQQLSNGWRTDHDVESYGKPTLTDWEHVARRFSHAAKWHPHAGPGGWNDFDSLNVANGSKDGLTDDEKRSYVSLWAIAASHFVIGSDLTNLDEYGIRLLTNDEIIGVNQSGVAGKRLFKKASVEVFYQKLPDGSYNLALFNTGPSEKNIQVQWSDLGIHGSALVHDQWSHEDLGTMESGFTTDLARHASQMIHVVPMSALTVSPKSGAIEVDPATLLLSWKSALIADSYRVQVARDVNMTDLVYDQNVASTSLKVKGLEKNNRYFWKVSAIAGGSQKQIGIYSFYTKMTTPPASPDWVIANRKSGNSVALSWNPTQGAKSYTVYRKSEGILGMAKWTMVATNLTTPTFVDQNANLQKNRNYVYVITADNGVGKSPKSTESNTNDTTLQEMAAPFIILFILFIGAAWAFGVWRSTGIQNVKQGRSH